MEREKGREIKRDKQTYRIENKKRHGTGRSRMIIERQIGKPIERNRDRYIAEDAMIEV